MLEFRTNYPELLMIHEADKYGGKIITFNFAPELWEMLEWFKKYKVQLEEERKLIAEYESVASAYAQYQTILKLVKQQLT
jgi:hypothetical protein